MQADPAISPKTQRERETSFKRTRLLLTFITGSPDPAPGAAHPQPPRTLPQVLRVPPVPVCRHTPGHTHVKLSHEAVPRAAATGLVSRALGLPSRGVPRHRGLPRSRPPLSSAVTLGRPRSGGASRTPPASDSTSNLYVQPKLSCCQTQSFITSRLFAKTQQFCT